MVGRSEVPRGIRDTARAAGAGGRSFLATTANACWRHANSLLTTRQQELDSAYELAEVPPPRPWPATRADPRCRQRAVRRARVRRGLDRGHRELRRRHPRARAPLLRRPQGRLRRTARTTWRPA